MQPLPGNIAANVTCMREIIEKRGKSIHKLCTKILKLRKRIKIWIRYSRKFLSIFFVNENHECHKRYTFSQSFYSCCWCRGQKCAHAQFVLMIFSEMGSFDIFWFHIWQKFESYIYMFDQKRKAFTGLLKEMIIHIQLKRAILDRDS